MSVNYEVKGQLARLLATENLIVEHKKCQTASFDVLNRVLVLPLWDRASGTVYDLLVSHEVGHALFTPNEDWTNRCYAPHQFVNIIEDARIEKLMKRKYAGLNKTFYRGYSELSDEDFFGIADNDLTKFNLADRANLYFKIGNYINIPINGDVEKDLIDLISECETFDDVLIAAEKLYDYCKKSQEKIEEVDVPARQDNEQSSSNSSSDSSQSSVDSTDDSQSENSESNSDDSSENSSSDRTNSSGGTTYDSDLDVKTADNLSDAIESLNDSGAFEPNYVEIPDIDLDSVIIKNDYIREINDFHWNPENHKDKPEFNFSFVDADYSSYKNSSLKEVNYLIKEFEMKKSADSYSRSSVSRTGVLDCTKLHTYKYNEDLFKKVTVVPDGKNHGLVFLLDWSGSMSDKLLDTVKQLLNLVRFCKKCNIPFDVYAFTNEFRSRFVPEEILRHEENPEQRFHHSEDANKIAIHREFKLLNFITSKTNQKDFDTDCLYLYRLAYIQDQSQRYRYEFQYHHNGCFSLSGTPLTEAIVCLNDILPKFKKETGVQKVQCVILTDGEAQGICRTVSFTTNRGDYVHTRIGINPCRYGTMLRNRKNGNVYEVGNWMTQVESLLRYVSDSNPGINMIGIRVVASNEVSRFFNLLPIDIDSAKIRSAWKKEKSISVKGLGYSTLLVISSNSLNTDSEFEVAESATKAQIRAAFKKSLKAGSMNRKILNSFVEQIV